jgi:hypothetical protein
MVQVFRRRNVTVSNCFGCVKPIWDFRGNQIRGVSMGLNDYDYSPTELLDMTAVVHPLNGPQQVSIGMALDTLANVADIGKEFQGDCDGIDVLCYHLSGSQCKKGIEALQKVLERFERLSIEKDQKTKQMMQEKKDKG